MCRSFIARKKPSQLSKPTTGREFWLCLGLTTTLNGKFVSLVDLRHFGRWSLNDLIMGSLLFRKVH
jgi:hypothetical protein